MAAILSERFRSRVFDLLVALSVALLATLGLTIRTAPHLTSVPGYVMAVALLFPRGWPLVTMGGGGAAAFSHVGRFPGDPGSPPASPPGGRAMVRSGEYRRPL